MPGCSRFCPKVKRDLKKQSAERRNALEGNAGPSKGKSLELEEEIQIYEYSADEILSRSVCSRSGKSYKSKSETLSRSVCSRSGRSFKSADSDFEGSDNESTDRRSERSQCIQVEDIPKAKRTGRRRKREEYESDGSEDYVSSSRKPCSSECSSKKLKEEKLKRKQKDPDGHLVNKGMNYFDDLCNCSSLCLVKQLWSDPFVRKTIVSLALFAVGVKLCFELDGWQIPT